MIFQQAALDGHEQQDIVHEFGEADANNGPLTDGKSGHHQ